MTVKNGSTIVASKSVTSNTCIINGLTDGTLYAVSVTASNPVGTGPESTSVVVTPSAVANGSSVYTQAVSQFLGAQASLVSGSTQSQADATSGDSQADSITSQLGKSAASDVNTALEGLSEDQQATDDTTNVDESLVSANTDGTVTVYAASHENYITQDTSDGSNVSSATSDWTAYTFNTSGSTPIMTGTIDANALLLPLSQADVDTAQPPSQANATSSDDATDSTTDTTTNTTTSTVTQTAFTKATSSTHVSRSVASTKRLQKIAAWARNNVKKVKDDFGEDCTNFVSKALYYGGGFRMIKPSGIIVPTHIDTNTHHWFSIWTGRTFTIKHKTYNYSARSSSWSVAVDSFRWQVIENAPRSSHPCDAQVGDIIYVNWYGTSSTNIGHAGIVTGFRITNGKIHLYISQHSNDARDEPLYRYDMKYSSQRCWLNIHPHLHIWVVRPTE